MAEWWSLSVPEWAWVGSTLEMARIMSGGVISLFKTQTSLTWRPFHLAFQMFRVGVMGYNARPQNIELVVASFREGLKAQGKLKA